MNLMTGETAQAPTTRAVAFAQLHRRMVLQEIGFAVGIALEWDAQNCKCFAQGRAGTKIEIIFAGLKHSRFAALVAIHADVFRQAYRQIGRIDDCAYRKSQTI